MKVRIEGTVIESWAAWLEKAMTARVAENVPAFKLRPEAIEAIQILKGETTVE